MAEDRSWTRSWISPESPWPRARRLTEAPCRAPAIAGASFIPLTGTRLWVHLNRGETWLCANHALLTAPAVGVA